MRVSLVQSSLRRAVRGLAVLGAVTALALTPLSVRADNYGSGVYGNDVYNSSTTPSTGGGSSSGSSSSSSGSSSSSQPASSSPTSESTVVETESGLEVAINLSDGQAIPPTGYYITITPLNGQGKSFDKAEIYLDGILAYSGAPDSTGTLKWLWDTANNPATKVKIVVLGPGSGVTTKEFSVTVSPVESSTSQTPDTSVPTETPATDGGWPAWLTWSVVGLGVLLVVGFIVWLIARRRRNDQLPPPPTAFTPMQ